MSNGGTCTTEELAEGVYCLTRGQHAGLVVVALSGFASLSAVVFIFILIARNFYYSRRGDAADATTQNEANGVAQSKRRLIKGPMDLFMLSLFSASLFQAIGVVLEVKWINDGKVRPGSFCTAQGIFQQLGQTLLAIQTTIITLYTFSHIWWNWDVELRTAYLVVGTVWSFLVLFIAIPASTHHTPPFYYPTPTGCWIHSRYSDYRLAGDFWLWLGLAVAVFLYTPLCLFFAGYINPEKWAFKINSREERAKFRKPETEDARDHKRATKFKLMICALAYCAPVLPAALARWFLFVHSDNKPFGTPTAQSVTKTIYTTSGVLDVVVFLLARQGLLLFGQSRGARKPFNIPAPICIGACVAVWIALNVLDILWIYDYIKAATDPVPHGIPNQTREGWKAYYVMMYLCGFLLGVVNCLGFLGYILAAFTNPQPLKIRQYLSRFLIIVLAVVMSLGPLFGPLIGLKVAGGLVWDRQCDARFSVEVILDGRPYYDSILKTNPSVASFFYGQPGRRMKYYKYGLTEDDNDTTIWHLRLIDVTIPPDLDPVYHPLAQELSYRFANHSVSATCATNTTSSAVTIPCMTGSFSDDGEPLSLTINDIRTGNVTKLRAVDKGVWAPVDDAPSVLLIKPDDRLGSIDVLRTAVTMKGMCTRLKLCVFA